LHEAHFIAFEIPRWLSLGLIIVIFAVAFIYAKMQGPVEPDDPLTEQVVVEADESIAAADGELSK
jgi:hypothetical protein